MKYGDTVRGLLRSDAMDRTFMVIGHLTGMQLDGTDFGENEVAILVVIDGNEDGYKTGHITYAAEHALEALA